MKKIIHKVHLYLGLFIGFIFFIIALSGAIYVWEPEISTLIYKQRVQQRNQPFVSVSALKANLAKELPEGDFRGVLFQGGQIQPISCYLCLEPIFSPSRIHTLAR